ncbi:bifunctional riboflavin kinase/FAD synthetase [Pararhizobium mangrovi]|uniref:Riboflavin biosynthesis protein n=1 Tax=Pararhizobium mangrovi TaxID=2590452 RepID=A0A506TYL7_9HYPH|nr:bifunctional riboflavin kinase/FAD synthetase [Pararhizobium mangrovi]TPW26590.1 bifunctional riboflavin kinase/FAD synthetase [Pararhizobium mangrovi]
MPFERIVLPAPVPRSLAGAVVAIGNFDGVHRGHRSVLEATLAMAREHDRPACVLTFEPHPRSFFRPGSPVFRLTPPLMRARLLEAEGFSAVVEQPFTGDFAALSPEAFVEGVLVETLGAAQVVTGFDFHFGKGRAGGPAFLMEAGERMGFGVTLVDAYRDENAEIVSSSRIRAMLAEGDVAEAAGLLGYRFTVAAEVEKGKQLGRTLGYPTANMVMPEAFGLSPGIYAVRLRRADGTLHDGVASFGYRPTVDEDGAPLLETYVFDFKGDLYGETCAVSFFARLRGEEKFDGLETLKAAMRNDEAEARAALSGVGPLSALDARIAF